MPDLNGWVLAVLQGRVGVINAISAADLASKASAFYNVEITGREIRQVVHDLRISGQPICSGSNGFYWPDSLQDVLRTADLEFRSEAKSLLQTARKIREAGRRLFGGQNRLI
jgi:hypothetical protein